MPPLSPSPRKPRRIARLDPEILHSRHRRGNTRNAISVRSRCG
jgi:hypothetical protein